MTYNAGTATDYIDLLEQLLEVLTSRHLDTIAVNNGGTGGTYVVGDILTISNTGATFSHTAQIEVTAVSAGQITDARIYRGGAYTVDPTTTTGNAVTGGGGTGATFDLTFAPTGWSILTRQSEVDTVDAVANGGSGYSVGNDLTLVGGVLAPGGSPATFNVDSVSSGAVATVSILTRGNYEVFPSDPVLTTVSPSGGTGATLNLTPRNTTGDTILVLQGDAGAATDPLVGIKTYQETDQTGLNTTYNWALFGMTAWDDAQALHNQNNVSPGFNTSLLDGSLVTTDGTGAYVPLKDNAGSPGFDMQWALRADGRSWQLIVRTESATTVRFAHAGAGLLNPYGIASELPYPAFVCGSSDRRKCWYRDTGSIFGGFTSAIELTSGPLYCWQPTGSWISVKSFTIGSATDTTKSQDGSVSGTRGLLWPLGCAQVQSSTEDRIWAVAAAAGFDNEDLTLAANATQIYRTPDTGGNLFPLFPVVATRHDGGTDIYIIFGEIPGVFWFSVPGDATIGSQDRFTQYPKAYSIFQNGTEVQPYDFCALRED